MAARTSFMLSGRIRASTIPLAHHFIRMAATHASLGSIGGSMILRAIYAAIGWTTMTVTIVPLLHFLN